jgi:hypothetical protein
MPITKAQKEAHERLLNYIADKFEVTPEELFNTKQAILDACDPTPYGD